jgi:ABC-type branched-subunit amino acid transport system substrate-binding protein
VATAGGSVFGASSGGVSTTTGSETPGGGTQSKRPIKLGVTEIDASALAAIFGVNGEVPDTPKAIVDYLNKHGGVGGRQLAAVYYKADSAADSSTSGQRACAKFTEDNRVDVVIDSLGNDVLSACLLQKGVAVFTTSNWALDSAALK